MNTTELGDRLLKALVERHLETLPPSPTVESYNGYTYQEVQDLLGLDSKEAVELLSALADWGLLDRERFEKVHLCPYCHHFALNFREVCPQCQSPRIDQVEMIHHYRCGYLSHEREFQDGTRLQCPKCHERLRHLGVDYERPTANYLCAACAFVFPDPHTSCRSLTCGKEFGVEQAVQEMIYTYRLTSKGALAASLGIRQVSTASQWVDQESGIYTFGIFLEMFSREVQRAARYGLPLSLMVLRAKNGEAYRTQWGREAAALLLKHLVVIIKESLRTSDFLAQSERPEQWLALLPNTTRDQALIAARRIQRTAAEFLSKGNDPPVGLGIGLAEWTKGMEGAQLMEEAIRLCDESCGDEGNGIRS